MDGQIYTRSQIEGIKEAMFAAHLADQSTERQVQAGSILAAMIYLSPFPTDTVRDIQTAIHTGASALDFFDGYGKNWAVKKASTILFGVQKDNRKDKPNKWQWERLERLGIVDQPRKDEQADKDYFYDVAPPLIVREGKQNRKITSAVLLGNVVISFIRDNLKTKDRDLAEELELATNATKHGKIKTVLHRVGIGILLARSGKYTAGRAIGASVMSVGTAFGLYDYWRYHKKIKHAET